MRSNVIDSKNSEHSIESYKFKVLSTFITNNEKEQQEPKPKEPVQTQQIIEEQPEPDNIEQSSPNLQPSFIEELLKRTDELSDNIVKLQMQIENQESEFKIRLEQEVARTKEESLKEGQEIARAEYESKLNDIEQKYLHSISKLDDVKSKFETLLSSTQKELASTAIEIAKEVVIKEIKDSSSIIASNIAKSLISELENASNIEIKANPKDYEFLKSNLNLNSRIKLSSDDAISIGGVIALSDVGNIDGSVVSRFEKIKKILSE